MAIADRSEHAKRLMGSDKAGKIGGRSLTSDAIRRLCRNRAAMLGAAIIILNILGAIFAAQIAPKAFDDADLLAVNSAPTWITKVFTGMKPRGTPGGYVKIDDSYPLGADSNGRDLFSRLLYGARISLAVAFMGPVISMLIGFAVGLVSGYAGGRIDNLLMRIVDIMYAFPTMLLILLLMTVFRATSKEATGPLVYAMSRLDASMGGLLFIFLGIGFTAWMGASRLVRGQVLSVREQDYILAARALGAPPGRIVLRHILPNVVGPLIITQTMSIPGYISYEAFLSFIGLGVNPPTPSWGGMIAEGSTSLQSFPNQAVFPALALFLLIFAFNFLGDGLRDALDSTMQGRT